VPPGVSERWAEVNGHRMRYLAAGSGPPLILVHGLMGYSFSWTENLLELARDFAVYAPDLFNAGWSERVEQDGSLETTARSLIQLLDVLRIEKASLVGSSHGGTLAMLTAVLAPGRIDKVVAIAPANSWSEQARWQARVFSTWWGAVAGYCIPYVPPLVHGYFVSRMYCDRSRILPGTIAGYNAPLKVKGTVPYLLNVMRCWSRDFAALDERLNTLDDSKVVFLWGECDRVVPIASRADLARKYPRAQWIVLPKTGHLPYEERPAEFNTVLLECLKG
jgi:pimeloyl-ACP methyl ester carboxylesterase